MNMDLVKTPALFLAIADESSGLKLKPIEAEIMLGYLEGSDFCLLHRFDDRLDCEVLRIHDNQSTDEDSGEDVNKMCAADGKTTQNFWIAWLLGLITAGVFQLVWIYGVVERIYDAGKRYGVETKCTGSTYLIWALVGSLLCGVGPFIALYKHVNDINAVAAAYNAAGVAR